MLSDDPADCSSTESPGDEFMDMVFVTVVMVVDVSVMSSVLVMTDVMPIQC